MQYEMGTAKRTKMETKANILRFLIENGPSLRTHVMFKVNLSWVVLEELLKDMIEKKLVSVISIRPIELAATEKGAEALRRFQDADVAFS